MKIRARTLLAFWMLLAVFSLPFRPVIAYDGDFKFDRYTIQDGLSQSTIQSILQDREGFIWFATLDGLNRFDGNKFVVYRHDPQFTGSTLPDNEVRNLYEDREGGIWVSTAGGGLSRFDKSTGTFISFRNDPEDPHSLSGGEVRCMYEDSRGSFWVGTETGLNRFNTTTREFTRFRYGVGTDDSGENVINEIYEDSRGAVWFGTNAGLKEYEISRGTFQSYDAGATAGYRIGKKKITSIREDKRGRMWIGTRNGLYIIDEKAGLTTHYQAAGNGPGVVSGDYIRFIRIDRAERLWVGTDNGLDVYDWELDGFRHYRNSLTSAKISTRNDFGSFLEDSYGLIWLLTSDGALFTLDPRSGVFTSYKHDPANPSSIAFNKVHCVFEDRSGNLWFGTIGGGLSKLSRKKIKFGLLEYIDGGSKMTLDVSATSLAVDGAGDVWIGTAEHGLAKYDISTGRLRWFKHNPAVRSSLSDDHVTSLAVDRYGHIWIGTRSGALDRLPLSGGNVLHYRERFAELARHDDLTINTLYADHRGDIWIGTSSGTHRLAMATGKLRTYDLGRGLKGQGQDVSITAFYEDYSGVMWIGTSTGHLVRLDTDTDWADGYIIKPEAEIRKLNSVTAIYGDRPDRIWVGTSASGLYTFSPATRTFGESIGRDQLSAERINGMLTDDRGNLWLSTNVGLTAFNTTSGKFRNYTFTDGLQGNEFNRRACARMVSGELLFGGISGINRFHPESVRDNPYVPEIVVTSFKKFDREVPVTRRADGLMSVELDYSENFFTFEFAAMDFTAPDRNQYAFYLEGFDNDWIQSGTRNIASYTNLDPGVYRFHVKGSNNDGVWNEEGSSVLISIDPPFWKARWFQFLVSLVFLGIVYYGYRYKTRSIQVQKKTLEREVRERTKELWQKARELRAARDELEVRVRDRTVELQSANEILRSEIDERIETQEELQRLKEFHENILQTMAEGMVVVNMEGIITFLNPAAGALLGYDSADLEGKHWSILVPSNSHDLVKAADERRKEGMADHYELQMLRKNGTRVDVFVGGSPLHIDGILSGTIAVFTDITGLKTAENRIKEQAALIDKARDAIIVTDVGGLITYWNQSAEQVYGWPSDAVAGKNIHTLLHGTSDKSSSGAARVILEMGEWSGELHQTTKDNRTVIMRSRWTLLQDAEGFPKSIMMINTDITEKVKLEKQFLRAQRMESLGTLASGIAHDLNNVLSPIIMALQVLRDKRGDDREGSLLTTMELSAKRGAEIVKQVLMFARGAEGQHEELQVKHLIREMESIVRGTFPKSIVCQADVPKDLWTIMGDPTQMHQVLLNLCVNARDAMPEGGRLDLKAENVMLENFEMQLHPETQSGPFIVISVSDTGHGMSQDTMMKIFEPFFTTKGVGKGTGLGLSTVNGIVKGHGGFINVYSEPDQGSVFRLYLPAVPHSDSKKGSDHQAYLPTGRGETILLVDDEPAILQIAKGTLETYGYKVLTASDGMEAEKLYREHRNEVVLVITDMMMPLMDGRATIRALKTINPEVKIVVTSGLVGNDKVVDEWGVQTQAFLPKPFTAEKLLKTLEGVLHTQRN